MKSNDQEELRIYLKDVRSKDETISLDYQEALATEAQNGDKKALAKLVDANLKLVLKYASQYSFNPKIDTSDLVQAGNIGLISGILKWDSQKGRLYNSLIIYIRAEIFKYLDLNSDTVRESNIRRRRRLFVSQESEKCIALGTPIDFDYISSKFKKVTNHPMSVNDVEFYYNSQNFSTLSMTYDVSTEQLEPFIQNNEEIEFLDISSDAENEINLKNDILNAIAEIKNNSYKMVIHDLYYLDMTKRDCAKKRGVTAARIYQLELKALVELKSKLLEMNSVKKLNISNNPKMEKLSVGEIKKFELVKKMQETAERKKNIRKNSPLL